MKEQTATVLGFANQKGGVGKSTLTHLVAKTLGNNGEKVLVIEVDKQATLTEIRERFMEEPGFIFPYDLIKCELSDFDSHLNRDNMSKYKYIFMDMPGTLDKEGITTMLVQADILFLPLSPSTFDVNSTVTFIEEVYEIKQRREQIGLPFDYFTVLNRVKPGTKAGRILMDKLEEYKVNPMESFISDYEAYKEHSTNYDKLVGDKSKPSLEFEKFVNELVLKVKRFQARTSVNEIIS